MNILEKLETLATIDNAKAWEREPEKTLFCSALIEAADIPSNPARVEVLEILFEKAFERLESDRAITRAFLEGQHSPSNRWP